MKNNAIKNSFKVNKNVNNYASLIDHTLLKPDATIAEIDKLIDEAQVYHFKTVCVNGSWAQYVSNKLENSHVGMTIVIGFPLGASSTLVKQYEAKNAIANGAAEIDMVLNIGWLKDRQTNLIINEIKKIKKTIGSKILKVIIETSLLDKTEIELASQLVIRGGADFVKTSTGFGSRGASFEDITTIFQVTQGKVGIKASGGIKTFNDLTTMINLGATRIGTSSSVELLKGEKNQSCY